MPRSYVVTMPEIAVTAVQDFLALAPAVNKPIQIKRVKIRQQTSPTSNSDEKMLVTLSRGFTTVGSGGAVVTPNPRDKDDTASGVTARRNDTVEAAGGTEEVLEEFYLGFYDPVDYSYPIDMRHRCSSESNENRFTLTLKDVPTSSVNIVAQITFEEI